MSDLEGSVRALAVELIEGFVHQGRCEFVEAFAKRLPIVVFLRLVDLPLEDRETLLEMTEASVRGDVARRNWAAQALQQYIGQWIVARRAHRVRDRSARWSTPRCMGATTRRKRPSA